MGRHWLNSLRTRLPERPLELVCFNDFFGHSLAEDPRWHLPPHRLHDDLSRLPEADAVLFHLPGLSPASTFPPKRPGQVWVSLTFESDHNYPHQADPHFMRRFDLRMSYRQSADLPLDYLWPTRLQDYLQPPSAKTEPAPAAIFISNGRPVSGREEYLDRLGRVLPIDRYGRHRATRSLPEDLGRATLLETLARYRFGLAFENAMDADYVTEKFFQCLVAGTIPVYLGAPNVEDFAPGDHSFIDASSFPHPEALGAYLTELARDEPALQAYHTWRQRPLRPAFLRRLEKAHEPLLAALVARLRPGRP